eukprot:7457748-Pyramimonas_sp.AAC.1
MKGFTLAVFIYYGVSGMGFTHENVNRFAKLGSVLTAIHLPWLVLADWNASPADLKRSEFLTRVGGSVWLSDAEFTCAPGGKQTSSHIDFVVCNEAARPYLRSVSAVFDVPWRPHIGLSIQIAAS